MFQAIVHVLKDETNEGNHLQKPVVKTWCTPIELVSDDASSNAGSVTHIQYLICSCIPQSLTTELPEEVCKEHN